MQNKYFGHIVALVVVFAWGTSFISTKVLMVDALLSPIECYIYRFALAYILLLAVTFRKIFAGSAKDELQFLLCGVCAGSLYYVLENYALRFTTAGNVSLLTGISPMITAALMALIFRARIGIGLIVGSIIAFAGVACIIFSNGEGFEVNPLGDFLAILSATSWSVYAIGVKSLVPKYSSLFITRKLFFYGVLTALPLLLINDSPIHFGVLFQDVSYIMNMLFLVIVCSLLAYVGWNYSLKSIGPVGANNYLYFQPVSTMVIAYFTIGEEVSLLGYLGCALVIGGLVISDKLQVKRSLHQLRK